MLQAEINKQMYGKALIQTKKSWGKTSRKLSVYVRSDAASLEAFFAQQKLSVYYWKKTTNNII